MAKSVSKLVPKVPVPPLPAMPGASKRAQYSASTKKTLVTVALALFTEHGYANTSLDQIVAGAQVTKGALYHHFSGKQALFEAVFTEVEDSTARVVRSAVKDERDPWERARIGLRTFLQVVQEPSYRRIVIQDGPAVLGYERFREQEERSAYAVVTDIMQGLLSSSDEEIDPELVATFARIVFGALSSAGESVAAATDPVGAAGRVEIALSVLLAGVQSLVDQGLKIADLEQPRSTEVD